MYKEEAKQWAEIFTAYAEGKSIELLHHDLSGNECWNIVSTIDPNINVDSYRIKPEKKTRRMTNQELADWLRDCPQEHREWKYAGSDIVYVVFDYHEDDANEEIASDIFIRHNHGEWEEPIIVEEE